jgi:hypothetical protein
MIASPRAESIDGSKSTLEMLGRFIGTSSTTKEHMCPKLWRNLYILERGQDYEKMIQARSFLL